VSPDSIVPEGRDPQSLNRFTYCRNQPVRYVDPTGHDGGWDPDWVKRFRDEHPGKDPTEKDWQDYLWSLSHPGTGPGGAWTYMDWVVYSKMSNPEAYWTPYRIAAAILGDLINYIGRPSWNTPGHAISTLAAWWAAIMRDILGKDVLQYPDQYDSALVLYAPTAPGSGGTTYGEVIYVGYASIGADEIAGIVHEYMHVLQYRKEGDRMYANYPIGASGYPPSFWKWADPGIEYWHRTQPVHYEWWEVAPDANAYEVFPCELQNLYKHYQGLLPPWEWK
jgi:hypothetical protein